MYQTSTSKLEKINSLTDVLGKIDKQIEHIFNKRKKVLFETCKQRSLRNLEPTEIAKCLTTIKKDLQRIYENGKTFLKVEVSQKAGKRIKPFTV